MQDATQGSNAQPTHAAADVAPDVAEAAAAAAFELPVHPIQPLPVAQAPPVECDEHAAGARSDDDGFEFGSDAASDSSSSWTSSDEETGAPLTSASLPSWLARRTAGGSDVDDDEDEAPARVVPAAEPEVPTPVLPPVEPTDEIRLAGTILSVVGTMIVVQASKDDALLDDGSTICFEDRSPLGQVDETFGPVQSPLYAVRRCEPGDAPSTAPAVGTQVFFVVSRSHFIEDIAKLHVKGYDASGKDDAELEEDEDFSDDEKEAEARALRKKRQRPRADALGMQPWQSNEVAGLLFGCFLLGSFLGAFKADALIALGQAGTLSGGQKRWKEEKAQRGDGRVIVIHGDAAGAAEDDEAEQ